MLSILKGSDWDKAFEYAGEQTGQNYHSADVRPAFPSSPVSLAPFCRNDVKEIIAIDAGENDIADWICFGKLSDGRYFFLSAGCNYTGWDCQSGGYAIVGFSAEEVQYLGISQAECQRLRLPFLFTEKPISTTFERIINHIRVSCLNGYYPIEISILDRYIFGSDRGSFVPGGLPGDMLHIEDARKLAQAILDAIDHAENVKDELR